MLVGKGKQRSGTRQRAISTERHLQDCNTYKETRAAALAEWRGLLFT
jgi:hypothetical protein